MMSFREQCIQNTNFLDNWFANENASPAQLSLIFESIPGVSFFVKDLSHRLTFL